MEGFDRVVFERATAEERRALCDRLADVITPRVRGAARFRQAVFAVVSELRAAGHDLWSFDDDGGSFELWCPDWVNPKGPGIVIGFRIDADATVYWSEPRLQ